MAKITQQFCLTEHNFKWLLEERIGRRQKNLSQTINEILSNYQYMIRSIQKAADKKAEEERKQKEAEEMIQGYKKQLNERVKNEIKTKHIDKKTSK